MKYFIYIRKSTDEDDRQVLSLEAQEVELQEFAKREQLTIVDVLRESQTAKEPGRPVFNAMLSRLERGEASGILSWHADRLARNSVDGGKIIYLVDTGVIQALKFPTLWFEPTPQGKFMLSIAFGQSKYFVDNLSENTKRGLRQKLRRGEWPGYAPLGYLNDKLTHKIVVDYERAPLVKKMFERYATGSYSLKAMQSVGLLSRNQKVLSVSNIQTILSNPFYYGVFKYNGELHDGQHEPLITKKLFDRVAGVLKNKSRPRVRGEKSYIFRGLLSCYECGCAITAETQKGHNYYRCTKKRIACSQPYIREELLASLISNEIQKVSLSPAWAEALLNKTENEKQEEAQAGQTLSLNIRNEIGVIEHKLDKLLDAHLDGSLSKDEYTTKKAKLLNHKVELNEKLSHFEREGHQWLEPMKRFILSAQQATIIAKSGNLSEMKNFFQKFGSNPRLNRREISFTPRGAWRILTDFSSGLSAAERFLPTRTWMLPG